MTLSLCCLLIAGAAQAPSRLLGDLDSGWDETWRREQLGGAETLYDAVEEDGGRVLRARSDDAATALFRALDRPRRAAGISWRWKVERSLRGNADERERRGDDYAARLFVIFGATTLGRNTRALCYVWAGELPIGTTFRSPYVSQVQTVVLQSGDGRAGTWVTEQRNLAADYRAAFGEEPPPVGAVALMVDTDDTGARAVAWYDEIVLR